MIQVINLSKTYGTQVIFDDISFSMSAGERLGLVGRNGSGKSTLIKLINGQEFPDQGRIVLPRDYKCGHLAQHLNFTQESVLKEACLGLPLEQREQEYRAEIILSGLGFSVTDMQRPAQEFSGGFQIRIELARVLLSEPNLLLLDEPTNYLDIVSVRWLERFLSEWQNELILISHDREFMDKVTNHSMLIRRSGIRKMKGKTGALYEQVSQEDAIYEQTRLNKESKKKEMEVFINRFRAKASKATLVQSKIKAMERLGSMDELQEESSLDFRFREAPFPGKCMLELENVDFAYPAKGEQLNPKLIEGFSLELRKGDRVGVIGKNGRGKSTLLKLMAGELEPVSGAINRSPNARLGYFGQTNILRLSNDLTVEQEIFSENETLSRTETRNICGTMMFGGDNALKKVAVLSGGEKSRVLIGKILARPTNLLLLDEPSNHLDQESVEVMIESIKEYEGAVVIVTHNELMLRELATRLVTFQGDSPEVFDGGYDYFLEKVGWQDEQLDKPSKSDSFGKNAEGAMAVSQSAGGERPLDKREKAQLRQERSRLLKPLEDKIKKLEDAICAMETELKEVENNLIEASQQGDGKSIAALSTRMALLKKEIDDSFDALAPLVCEQDRIKAEFEAKLGN